MEKDNLVSITEHKKGRPPADIDMTLVEDLASIGATYDEIAHITKVSRGTIYNRCHEVVKAGHADMKQSIRRKQFQVAMEGKVAMLIWLGKQHLNQRAEPEARYDEDDA